MLSEYQNDYQNVYDQNYSYSKKLLIRNWE